MKRDAGFYWVRYDGAGWVVAEWWPVGLYWFLAGVDEAFVDSDFNEIDPRRIQRPESK